MTMHIEMIAAASNFGWPNRKNPPKPTHLAASHWRSQQAHRPGHQRPDRDGKQHGDLADEPVKFGVITTMSSMTRLASASAETSP